jgi:hypothetical protein
MLELVQLHPERRFSTPENADVDRRFVAQRELLLLYGLQDVGRGVVEAQRDQVPHVNLELELGYARLSVKKLTPEPARRRTDSPRS